MPPRFILFPLQPSTVLWLYVKHAVILLAMRIDSIRYLILTAGALLAASCGGGEDTPTVTPSPTATAEAAAPATVAPTPPGERIPYQGKDHIQSGGSHPAYSSMPATSGWHYGRPSAPADWGVHEEVLTDEVLVHNLEHGGIGVHYSCPESCDDLVARLHETVTRARDNGKKVLMSPYPGMDTRIALTAWTFMDRFDEFDEQRVTQFISAHESSLNAPEPFVR